MPHDRKDERLCLHGLRTPLSGEGDAGLDAPPNMRLNLAAPSGQGRIAFVASESVRRSLGAIR